MTGEVEQYGVVWNNTHSRWELCPADAKLANKRIVTMPRALAEKQSAIFRDYDSFTCLLKRAVAKAPRPAGMA